MTHQNPQDYIPDDEDFKMLIQVVQEAKPMPREQFQHELRQRLLKEEKSTFATARFGKRRVSLLLVAVLLLMTSAIAYAATSLLQQILMLDGGLDASEGYPLNMSQTLNNVTLTLEWIYVDSNRVSIGFSGHAESEALAGIAPSKVTLHDAQGLEYEAFSGVGTHSDASGFGAVYSFLIPEGHSLNSGETLSLTIDLQLVNRDAQFVYIDSFQFEIESPAPISELLTNFNLPQTVNSQGIDITLNRIELSPSLTRIEFCFTVEDPDFSEWFALALLQVGERNISEEPILIDGSPRTVPNCHFINFHVDLSEAEGIWTITITQLMATRLLDLDEGYTIADTQKRIDGLWIFQLERQAP